MHGDKSATERAVADEQISADQSNTNTSKPAPVQTTADHSDTMKSNKVEVHSTNNGSQSCTTKSNKSN